ncbi:helix-turn-helix transcriptional regulator [Amycolatopsis cynarae]|uniref:Helix-turn-helix transcriptional regulator n=1 Tax=Amycolatopsis cynarae TaxID=2995223 RepID=A0ABY7B5R7_9PSEU|nr:helix-turn-helix transcriptional regulator [Amycolatopsis sp. HUAS 11-8]WAL67506.1 helix-turn-helix transcriptional regulator [Amycolatopsis sp. HUAS 11-8]
MSLRHALLGLLAGGPGSGYDLLRKFEISLANVWPATQSQVYTELSRLAATGLIEVTAEGPRGRKEYAITDEGRAELRHWVLEVPPQQRRRNDLLLRVFFLDTVDPAEAREFLLRSRDQVAELRDGLRKVRESVDWGDDSLSVYGTLALEWGLRYATMHVEWAEWAIGRLPGK